MVDRTAPTGDLDGSYVRSKQDSDRAVWVLQAASAPSVRAHPCAQDGPDDPYLDASNALIRDTLRGLYPMWTSGSLPWGDVRDTAATIAAVVSGRGDDAAAGISPCHHLPDDVVPGGLVGPVIRSAQPLIRVLPERMQVPLPQEESTQLSTSGTVYDDAATVEILGARQAGRAAGRARSLILTQRSPGTTCAIREAVAQ